MRLTTYSDYALRVLIFVALKREGALTTIQEIAEGYGISKNHLMKVVQALGHQHLLENVRGRNGGIRLAKPPEQINLADVLRATEEDFALVECFDRRRNACRIATDCRLRHVLSDALQAFFSTLDRYTLADLIEPQSSLAVLLDVPAAERRVP